MKTVLIAFAFFLPATLMAQSSLPSFFSKYEGKDGFTSVKVSPKAFQLIAAADVDDETMQALTDITGLYVLTFDNADGKNPEKAEQLKNEAYAAIGAGYEELLSVKEGTTDLKILARSANEGVISDLLIVGNDDGEFVFVDVTGKMDLKKLNALTDVDVKGMEKLKEVNTEKK
jgi:hypothetical protein